MDGKELTLLPGSKLKGTSLLVLVIKNLPANTGGIRNLGSIPGSGRSPGGGHGNPLQYFCLENTHGKRSLAGYCPELDTTEVI